MNEKNESRCYFWECEKIVRCGRTVRPNMNREQYFKTVWINVSDLLEYIESCRDNGNMEVTNGIGFSAGLFLSDFLKMLREFSKLEKEVEQK